MIKPAPILIEEQYVVDESMTCFINKQVLQTAPKHQCPNCKTPMLIGGRYEKGNVEGVAKMCQHDCYNCGKRITPECLTK